MRRWPRPAPLATLVVAATLAGCGGDGGAPVDPAADQEVAEAAIAALEAELEGAGYVASEEGPDDADGATATTEPVSEACAELEAAFPSGESAELPGETAQAESADYERGGDESDPFAASEFAGGFVGFLDREERAEELFALFDDETLEQCIDESLEQSMAPQGDGAPPLGADFDVEVLDGSGLGDDEAGVAMRGTFGFGGFSFPMAFEVRLVRVGRGVVGVASGVFGETDGEPPDSQLWVELLVDEVEAYLA